LVISVLVRPLILFPQWMHGDFFALERFVLLLPNHPVECLLLVLAKVHDKCVRRFHGRCVEVEGLGFFIQRVQLVLFQLCAFFSLITWW